MLDEQKKIYDQIMETVSSERGGVFFLYGYGGTGKTYMWNTLSASLRSRGDIVLNVATSGIAALLLPGGRTAHSRFKIPIPTLQSSICNIEKGSELAELLRQTKLIIWDEAPMANKYCFEALDKSLKDIMSVKGKASNQIFGGKTVVFGGDFRQILPVVPRGNRFDIIHSTINASYIWDQCHVLKLTKNMRLLNGQAEICQETQKFSEWILKVGDGKLGEGNDGYNEIDIPKELLISDFEDPIEAIVQSTYPNLLQNFHNENFMRNKAILASSIQVVDDINNFILNLIPGN